MTRLSVNLNKIALLRNPRTIGIPSVLRAAELAIEAGAHGITVHPRPEQRDIRPSDVYELALLLRRFPGVEFNIEGNPFPEFMEIVRRTRPTQCTLVPDAPGAPPEIGIRISVGASPADVLRLVLRQITSLAAIWGCGLVQCDARWCIIAAMATLDEWETT